MHDFRSLGPGLVIAGLVALAASWLAEHYATPVMLFALLLGIAVNFLSQDERCQPGLDFASRDILRVGVALLGARITFAQVQSLGGSALLLTATAVVLTILCGIVLARSAGLSRRFGVLTGGSVAICGASAALAIASVLPRTPEHERDTIMTVVAVTTLSTIAMVVYPVLAAAMGFDPHTTGIFLGRHHPRRRAGGRRRLQRVERGRRHGDDRQAVPGRAAAAGGAGDFVPAAALGAPRQATDAGRHCCRCSCVGFATLVVVNSLGGLPVAVATVLQEASRWCLVLAIAALGTRTSLGDLARVGWRPVAIIVGETLFVGLLVLGVLLVLKP